MADVQEVLIDFKVNYSELTNAQEQLAKSGKIDTSQFAAVSKAISSTAADTQGLIKEFKTVATTATKMGKSVEDAFGAGIQDALDEAGVSVKEFSDALTKANTPTKSLKKELLELKESLARMKAEGKDTGAEFDALRARAGKLSDAIADAGAEIKNAGSDTRNIDNVVGSISALAGGFAAAQGAIALFGDEDKDLQKALLKVNGAMALASGIQQFYNATLKEGALTKLKDSIATGIQSSAITLYTFVTAGATLATKALRAAIVTTGIGALVVLVIALVQAWNDHNDKVADAKKSIEDLDKAYEGLSDSINTFNNEQADIAKAGGAAESAVLKIRLEGVNKLIAANRNLENEKRIAINQSAKNGKVETELVENLNKTIQEGVKLRSQQRVLDAQISSQTKQELDDAAKKADEANKKRIEDAKKLAAQQRANRDLELKDTLALLELNLNAAKKGSEIELDLKKKIVKQKSLIELNQEKLTQNQILLIKSKAFSDQIELQKVFNETATKEQLQSQIDTNAAILAGIGVSNEERLRLQIENLQTTSTLEINAAGDNAAKVLLIQSKLQADIRVLKIKAIDDERAAEDRASNTPRIKNALARIAEDAKEQLQVRIAAIQGIEREELSANQRSIDDNKRKFDEQLIDLKEYNQKYSELAGERADIEEQTRKKIADINKQEKDQRIQNIKEIASETINVLSQVASFFSSLSELATEQDRQRIDAQKKQLQSLIDAGAITAKQAKIRAQEIEIAERKARQRQAQREKQAAVFKALLAIPTAFLSGLSQGGIYLAAIYAALAAAEAAVIISRPVPKFFRGKKDSYEGPGMVADMGPELVERGGRMFLYTNPTQTYLGAKDKVYTASETRNILHNTNISTTPAKEKAERLDYDRLAKAIPKSSFAVNIDKDFIEESVANGLSKTRNFNKRYSFK